MKLDKNDLSNKSSILAEKFCHLRLSALVSVIIASCDAKNLPHLVICLPLPWG